MPKSRDRKKTQVTRQAREIELMNAGMTRTQIAAELGISRTTFWRDISELTKRYLEGNKEAFTQLRELQVGALLDLAREVYEGALNPEAGNTIRGFLDSVAKIRGWNAPVKSLSVRTTTTLTPLDFEIREAFFGLSPEVVTAELARIRALPREATVLDLSGFAPKQLTEGGGE